MTALRTSAPKTTLLRTPIRPTTTREITVVDPSAVDEFLRDPIGFGEFDFGDPISLAEFSTTRHFHGCYAAPLS